MLNLLLFFLAVAGVSSQPTVQVKNGTLGGISSPPQYNQDYFLGIPYAQPPTGDLRFRQAVSLNESWEGIKDADQLSPECVGYGADQVPYQVSEDCLTLNVYRPAGYENGEKLPVAFWIHGGGFVNGGNADQRYNLTFFVENSVKIGKPVIAVAINYRLSAWGFLASDEMMGQGLVNMGLRDQRLAMHWVQENIGAFGGDPEKVTIWGESAGAASVGFHLLAYGGRDDKLFRAAVLESGGPIFYSNQNGTQYFQPIFDSLVQEAGCWESWDKIQCLRDLPFEKLNSVINSTTYSDAFVNPLIDGDFTRTYGSTQVERGQFVQVPLLAGSNSDEGTSFTPYPIDTDDDFRALVESGIQKPPSFVDEMVFAYPNNRSFLGLQNLPLGTHLNSTFGRQFPRAATYVGDWVFTAPRRRFVRRFAEKLPVWTYRFNAIPTGVEPWHGVGHFKEIVFVFRNWLGIGYPTEENTLLGKPKSYFELSDLMASSWISFMTDLDPNSYRRGGESRRKEGGVELWPRYDVVDGPMDFVFDANVTSHAERDDWREGAFKLINDNAVGVYHR